MTDPQLLISVYLHDAMSAEQLVELQAWIKADIANARIFVAETYIHRQVRDAIVGEDNRRMEAVIDVGSSDSSFMIASFDGAALLEVAEREKAARAQREAKREAAERAIREEEAERIEIRRMILGRTTPVKPIHHMVIPRVLMYGSIAAAVALIVTLVYSFMPKQPTPQVIDVAAEPIAVAVLSSVSDAQWEDVSLPTETGRILRQGRHKLVSGHVELTFDCGAVVYVKAPATLELDEIDRCRLIEGSIAAHVPPRATGFTVASKTMKVVDIGTEFGMQVDFKTGTQVHVFVGRVNAASIDERGDVGMLQLVRANEARSTESGELIAIDWEKETFTWALPHLEMLDRNLIINGDFETDKPGIFRLKAESEGEGYYAEDIEITGWKDNAPATVVNYEQAAESDCPDPALHPMPDQRGGNYFYAIQPCSISQDIDLTLLASLTDRDELEFDFSGWLGGFDIQNDPIILTAQFLNESGHELRKVQLGPLLPSMRNNQSGFIYFKNPTQSVPIAARTVRIQLSAEGGAAPSVTDGYADNLSFKLKGRKQ